MKSSRYQHISPPRRFASKTFSPWSFYKLEIADDDENGRTETTGNDEKNGRKRQRHLRRSFLSSCFPRLRRPNVFAVVRIFECRNFLATGETRLRRNVDNSSNSGSTKRSADCWTKCVRCARTTWPRWRHVWNALATNLTRWSGSVVSTVTCAATVYRASSATEHLYTRRWVDCIQQPKSYCSTTRWIMTTFTCLCLSSRPHSCITISWWDNWTKFRKQKVPVRTYSENNQLKRSCFHPMQRTQRTLSGVDKKGRKSRGPSLFPIIQTKHKHTLKLHYICQFGKFVLRKKIKTVAIRYLFKSKCTKFNFGWGSAPDVAGELTALPHAPGCILGGPTSKEKKGRKKEKTEEKGGKSKKMKERGRWTDERGVRRRRETSPLLNWNFWLRHCERKKVRNRRSWCDVATWL